MTAIRLMAFLLVATGAHAQSVKIVMEPSEPSHAATKRYVDAAILAALDVGTKFVGGSLEFALDDVPLVVRSVSFKAPAGGIAIAMGNGYVNFDAGAAAVCSLTTGVTLEPGFLVLAGNKIRQKVTSGGFMPLSVVRVLKLTPRQIVSVSLVCQRVLQPRLGRVSLHDVSLVVIYAREDLRKDF